MLGCWAAAKYQIFAVCLVVAVASHGKYCQEWVHVKYKTTHISSGADINFRTEGNKCICTNVQVIKLFREGVGRLNICQKYVIRNEVCTF